MSEADKYHEIDKRIAKIELLIDNITGANNRLFTKTDEFDTMFISINDRLATAERHVKFEDEDRPRRIERVDKVISDLSLLKQSHDACMEKQREDVIYNRNRRGSLRDNLVLTLLGVVVSILSWLVARGSIFK